MKYVFHKMVPALTLFGVSLSMIGTTFAADSRHKATSLNSTWNGSLLKGRAPASMNPLLEQKTVDSKPSHRWRLMGTCRQDSGMHRSQNGLGYGDCNH